MDYLIILLITMFRELCMFVDSKHIPEDVLKFFARFTITCVISKVENCWKKFLIK